MKGEIIAIGDELTSGRTINTTSCFAARHLFDAGYEIYAMHTIGDTPELIGEALKRALTCVDFVIVTGGLGTTDDDLTNEAVSQALNRPTLPNFEILAQIRQQLGTNNGVLQNPLEKLAWLPEGAEAFNPKEGMAGYQLVHDAKPIFFLPGIPSQMEHLLVKHVLPRLSIWYSDPSKQVQQKMLRVFNMDEGTVNKHIVGLQLDPCVTIGYYPVFPELHVSLTVRGLSSTDSTRLITDTSARIKQTLGSAIYGEDTDEMEHVVGKLLKQQEMKLAVAESCTGGRISSKITRVPGSSSYYLGGITAYADSMKEKFLNISTQMLTEKGAVSPEVAEAMAMNVQLKTGADITLSATGIAGPDGGSDEKPLGTVYMSLATRKEVKTFTFAFDGYRDQIQEITAVTGLDLIRRYLQNIL